MKKRKIKAAGSVSRMAITFFDLLFTAISLTFCTYLAVITSHSSYTSIYLSALLPTGSTLTAAVLLGCFAVSGAALLFLPEKAAFRTGADIIYPILCLLGSLYFMLALKEIKLLRLLLVPNVLYIAAVAVNIIFLHRENKIKENLEAEEN